MIMRLRRCGLSRCRAQFFFDLIYISISFYPLLIPSLCPCHSPVPSHGLKYFDFMTKAMQRTKTRARTRKKTK